MQKILFAAVAALCFAACGTGQSEDGSVGDPNSNTQPSGNDGKKTPPASSSESATPPAGSAGAPLTSPPSCEDLEISELMEIEDWNCTQLFPTLSQILIYEDDAGACQMDIVDYVKGLTLPTEGVSFALKPDGPYSITIDKSLTGTEEVVCTPVSL